MWQIIRKYVALVRAKFRSRKPAPPNEKNPANSIRRALPGTLLGLLSGAASAQTWKPVATDVDSKVSKTGDTMSGTLSIVGGRLVVKGDAAGSHAYIEMFDDESPNGRKYVHANSNWIGFVGGGGGWIQLTNEAGEMYTPAYGWLHNYFMRVDPDYTYTTTTTGNGESFPYYQAWYWDASYANTQARAIRRVRAYLTNCNCNCNCACNCQCK